MISVREQSGTVVVQQAALPSLVVTGGLFGLLTALTLLDGSRPAHAWLATAALFAIGCGCVFIGLRKSALCTLDRGQDGTGAREVGGLRVGWSRLDDSRVEVMSDRGKLLFGGTRVVQVLQAAERVSTLLGVPLEVETSLSDAIPRSIPPGPRQGGPWQLPHSGALRRAEQAVWGVGIAGAIQMPLLVLGEYSSIASVHPLSVVLAIATPLVLLAIALGLRSREPRIEIGEQLSVESRFLGRCWSRTVFDRAETSYTLLQHPRLDLGFVWLRSPRSSLVLSSTAGSAAAMAAYLTSHAVPDSNRRQ